MILTFEQVFARMDGSATLRALVGTSGSPSSVNAFPDWPEETWDGSEPRVVYTIPYGSQNGAVRVHGCQLDVFVPRDLGFDVAGGVETELKALFHEKWWVDGHSNQRVYTLVVNEDSRPSSYDEPIHWMFEVAVLAST